MYSAALCRGLIEAAARSVPYESALMCIPRLYAAASLKLLDDAPLERDLEPYSAALCRGLIEALSRD